MDISPRASYHRQCRMFPFVPAVSFCPNQVQPCVMGKGTRTSAMESAKSSKGMMGSGKVEQVLRRKRLKKKQGETKSICFALFRHDRSGGDYVRLITCSSGIPPGLPPDPEAPWTDRPSPAIRRTFHQGICGSSCNGRRQGRHLPYGGHHQRRNG